MHSTEVIIDTPVPPNMRNELVRDSIEYSIEARVVGESLRLSVKQSETCVEIVTPQTHRVRAVTRTAAPGVTRTTWTLAVLGLAGGAYGYLDAEALSIRNTGSPDSAEQYRTYATAIALLGLAATVVGIVDTARAGDSRYDDGIIDGRARRRTETCRARRTANVDVSVQLANGSSVAGHLNDHGLVDVSLLSVPEAGLPDPSTEVTATLAGKVVPVHLSTEQLESLRGALSANPLSRLSTERLARRRAQCDTSVAAARSATPPDPLPIPSAARDGWAAAKTSCDDLWTASLEADLLAVENRAALDTCGHRLSLVAVPIAAGEFELLDEINAELVSVRDTCKSPQHTEQVRELFAKLKPLEKRREAQLRQEQRRIAREESRAEQAKQREAREERRRDQERARRQRSWGGARLLCNDGTLSPSCTCGRSSYRGCCSWHGGVNRCSVSPP
jgi:hypothetical protein